ncbi:MAG: hypothetical protein PHH26_05275 [Candidatus Thermoplasmatota archaeon]|nr:hypothetical protein [Candidatus Thermoplasmatota archaeon]
MDVCFLYPVSRVVCPDAPATDLGLLPDAAWLAAHPWEVIVLHEQVWWPGEPYRKTPGGPYLPWRRDEVERFATDCHEQACKLLVYASPFYWWKRTDEVVGARLVEDLLVTGADGWYLDYLLPDRVASRGLLAELRQRNPDRMIIAHVSHIKNAGFDGEVWPEVEEFCDLVADGELVPFDESWFGRIKQHLKPWIWHAGPAANPETNLKAYTAAGRTDKPAWPHGMPDAVIGRLAAADGGIIPGWSAPSPKDGDYVWSGGTSPRYRAWKNVR